MVVHQNITNLAGYFHFLNVRKIPYVIHVGMEGLTEYGLRLNARSCNPIKRHATKKAAQNGGLIL